MSKPQRHAATIIILIWAFFHFILWSSAGYTIHRPLEYLDNYLSNVILPTILIGGLYLYLATRKNPRILPDKLYNHLLITRRKEALKKRIDAEWAPKVIYGLGNIVFLAIIVRLSIWLMQTFKDNKHIHDWGMSVLRRYDLLQVANAISYPRSENGYFLSIIGYYWGDKHITFELCPAIGTARAKRAITKRLVTKLHKPARHIQYRVTGTHLFVTIPRSWVIPKNYH